MNKAPQPIYVYWKSCTQCGYETVAHSRVDCPDCDDNPLTPDTLAGAVVDDRRGDIDE